MSLKRFGNSTVTGSLAASSPQLSGLGISARRHADAAVEADVLTVEIAILDHAHGEIGIFVGNPEALRVEHRGAERVAHRLRRAGEQRGVENARQDRVDADILVAEIARERERDRKSTRL